MKDQAYLRIRKNSLGGEENSVDVPILEDGTAIVEISIGPGQEKVYSVDAKGAKIISK